MKKQLSAGGKRMKKQWIAALGAVAALGLACALIVNGMPQAAPVSVATVQFGDFSVAVDVQGEVRPSEEYWIMPAVGGRVKEIFVREGQQVKKGQKLFQLDDENAASQLQQARYELQLALNAQDDANEQLMKQAEIEQKQIAAEQEARTAMALAETQGLKQAAEEALAMAQNMGIDYYSFNRALSMESAAGASVDEQMGGTQESEGEMPVAPTPTPRGDPRVSLARERVKQAEYAVAQHTLLSDNEGKVLRLNIRAGEMIAAGTSAMVIGETSKATIVAQLGERDLARISLGQRAHLTVDGKTYGGRVVRVSPAAMRTSASAQPMGEVEIQPDAGFNALVGASVEMSVVVAQASNTCRVPQECVLEENGEAVVYVARNGALKRRSVKLGLRDDFNVEITEGLVMGERVVMSPSTASDGQRIRIVD